MITFIAAAALAAQPATPAPTAPQAPHEMQMGHDTDHKGMDCCKDCCKHMAGKHDGQASEHREHSAQ